MFSEHKLNSENVDFLSKIKYRNSKIYNYSCKIIRMNGKYRVKIYKNDRIISSIIFRGGIGCVKSDERYECCFYKKNNWILFNTGCCVACFCFEKIKLERGIACSNRGEFSEIVFFDEKNQRFIFKLKDKEQYLLWVGEYNVLINSKEIDDYDSYLPSFKKDDKKTYIGISQILLELLKEIAENEMDFNGISKFLNEKEVKKTENDNKIINCHFKDGIEKMESSYFERMDSSFIQTFEDGNDDNYYFPLFNSKDADTFEFLDYCDCKNPNYYMGVLLVYLRNAFKIGMISI